MNRLISIALALALTTCGIPASQVQRDTDLIANAVQAELPVILTALSADDQAAAKGYAADIEAARQAIDAAVASGKPVNAQSLVAALTALAPIVSAHLPPDSPAVIAIAAGVALLPIVLAESEVTTARANTPAGMTEARMVLAGVGR